MITTILILLLIGVALFLVYLAFSKWLPGWPTAVAGVVMALIFLLIVLQMLGVLDGNSGRVR